MYAVISSPSFLKEIEDVIFSKEEDILFKSIDTEININEELEKISRIAIKHLIIDITSLSEEDKLPLAIRRFRIKRETTQIIIIAPGYVPGNETLSLLVSMGVYDILAPQEGEGNIHISSLLSEVLDKPSSYARAVKWDIGAEMTNVVTEHSEKVVEKVKIKVEYRDVVESVFKKVIAVYSPTGEGSSTIASHLAHSLASSKQCKVALLDFEIFNPIQREIFGINPSYTLKDALDAVVKKTLSPTILESYMEKSKHNKNLDILSGLYDINEYYNTQESYFEEIIEKAKFSYDYVVIDTNSLYDLFPTNISLLVADEVLIPVRGRKHSIDTVNRYIANFKEYNDFDIRKFNLIINQYSGNDLTSIEIQSKAMQPIMGYISYDKNYDRANVFNIPKKMNEYIGILNGIGIKAKKKNNIFNYFNKKVRSKKGDA